MRIYKPIPYGKKVEQNLIQSLRMAGATLETSGEMDHNHKVDFLFRFNRQIIGVQVSLKGNDLKKIRVAKICALDVVPRFFYLIVAKGLFDRPNRRTGEYLYRSLSHIASNFVEQALAVNINQRGCQIEAL